MEDRTIEFTVSMKTGYIFEFLYVNSYSGFRGVINYGFSAIAIAALIMGYGDQIYSKIALILLALLFTVISPAMLLFKAWRQMKMNQGFKKPVHYAFNKSSIILSQETESQEVPWEIVLLAQETFKSILLFTGNNSATILPKDCIGEELPAFKALLREMCPPGCIKLKK